jgi:hypothetical protein
MEYGTKRRAKTGRRIPVGIAIKYKRSASKIRLGGAFIAAMPSTGHKGVFVRTGKGRYSTGSPKIQERSGPSIPTLLGSPKIFSRLSALVRQKLPELVTNEIDRFIKYGAWKR